MKKESTAHNDRLTRFLFEDLAVRGELVVLGDTYKCILENHQYPDPVKNLLGELLVVTSLLTATLKFEGNITVQIQGDGPVSLAVVNGNSRQQLRGIARVKEGVLPESTFRELVGKGVLVITIAPKKGEQHQGIVELEYDTLTKCVENYFSQSEQLPTKLFLRTETETPTPYAGGILLQVLPSVDKISVDFEHLMALTDTIKATELFTLPAEEVLYRLYHQENVRLFEDKSVSFHCGCSMERCANSLMALGEKEIASLLKKQGKLNIHCDYCGKHYSFDSIDMEKLTKEHKLNKDNLH